MLFAQKLQNTLAEMRDISNMDFCLYDMQGRCKATTGQMDENLASVITRFIEGEAEKQHHEDGMLYKVMIDDEVEYVLVVTGRAEHVDIIGRMAVCQIRNLIISKTEQFDRNNFMQNLLLGNMLKVDIYGKAKRLHIEAKPRVTYVIDTNGKSTDLVMELVKNLSDLKSGDFVTSVDEQSVVLVKDVSYIKEKHLDKELKELAKSLVDNIHMEAMTKVRIGYGNVVTQLPEIAESYQEAKMALQVGKIFYAEYDTISYSRLGIGRLIHQLPLSLCDMFIKEVFGDEIPEILEDEEAVSTINKFFENNLNISETARQLYVHRNTLVYRLERLEKAIGLDIRKFDDAMTYRIAVMVLAHMKDQRG
jgi:carbohydrate diacid regulator